MIDYPSLARELSLYFGTEVAFEKNATSFIVTRHAKPIEGRVLAPIYSSEFSFTEEKIEFIAWFQMPTLDEKGNSNKEKHIKTVEILNQFAGNYRPGTMSFELHERINFFWIGVRYSIFFTKSTPYAFWGSFFYSVSTDLCKRIFEKFCSPIYWDRVGLRPGWMRWDVKV